MKHYAILKSLTFDALYVCSLSFLLLMSVLVLSSPFVCACRYLLTSQIDQSQSVITQTASDLWSIQKLEQELMILKKSLRILGFLGLRMNETFCENAVHSVNRTFFLQFVYNFSYFPFWFRGQNLGFDWISSWPFLTFVFCFHGLNHFTWYGKSNNLGRFGFHTV